MALYERTVFDTAKSMGRPMADPAEAERLAKMQMYLQLMRSAGGGGGARGGVGPVKTASDHRQEFIRKGAEEELLKQATAKQSVFNFGQWEAPPPIIHNVGLDPARLLAYNSPVQQAGRADAYTLPPPPNPLDVARAGAVNAQTSAFEKATAREDEEYKAQKAREARAPIDREIQNFQDQFGPFLQRGVAGDDLDPQVAEAMRVFLRNASETAQGEILGDLRSRNLRENYGFMQQMMPVHLQSAMAGFGKAPDPMEEDDMASFLLRNPGTFNPLAMLVNALFQTRDKPLDLNEFPGAPKALAPIPSAERRTKQPGMVYDELGRLVPGSEKQQENLQAYKERQAASGPPTQLGRRQDSVSPPLGGDSLKAFEAALRMLLGQIAQGGGF